MRKYEKGMSLVVKTVTRLTLGFILLYGIYITLNGHAAPGGGFAGGVIIALSLVHIMLAFGKEVALKRLRAYMLRIVISAAALVFLAVVMVSFSGRCLPLNMFLGGKKVFALLGRNIRPEIQSESGQDKLRMFSSEIGLRDRPPAVFFGQEPQALQFCDHMIEGETPKNGRCPVT